MKFTIKEFFNSIVKKKRTNNPKLKFTGERLIPHQPELMNLFQEHITRYMFCTQFVKNKSVLDAGCGTGYGSYLLSQQGAKSVIGIDNSKEAIQYAQNNFKDKKLKFIEDDSTKSNLSDSSINVVVAFELIEHLENPKSFISDVNRILKKNGLFILSTPNKITYNAANPFHHKEYTENELVNFLKKSFSNVSIFYQSYPSSLAIHQPKNNFGVQELNIEGNSGKNDENALYFLAVCTNAKLPIHSSKLFLFDEKTSLLKNFPILQKQIRKLDNEIIEKDAIFSELQKEFEERSQWALSLDKEVEERKKQTLHFKEISEQKEQELAKIQNESQQKEQELAKIQNESQQKEQELAKIQNESQQKEQELAKIQEEIQQREKKISYYEKEISNKDELLEEKRNELKNLQTEISNKAFELATIQNSFIYKRMKKLSNFIDKVSPPGSKRREVARLSIESTRIIKNKGLKEFSTAAGAKIDSISMKNRLEHKIKKPQIKRAKLDTSLTTIDAEQLIKRCC